ncbi:RtcB family protein [Photobacterium sp. 1_MG-2023]|uniref:RtcB family protein n=1 Tax=Photobacterium sp. 1_MG-2023 TaxID=3062646 RepID=UPI0026E48535|nr:RtcB family protein [Photobacterium sp. 1_MG-2023]MDO6708573.1 RtcB family protein [Photobacterium sp. 1_MG-2023]
MSHEKRHEKQYETLASTGHVSIHARTRGVPFDAKAQAQLKNIAAMDIVHHHIAVMPDVHLGKGATIGSVIPSVNAPSRCGMPQRCQHDRRNTHGLQRYRERDGRPERSG